MSLKTFPSICFLTLITLAITGCGGGSSGSTTGGVDDAEPTQNEASVALSVNPNDPLIFSYELNDTKVNGYGRKASDGSALEIDYLQYYTGESAEKFDTIYIDRSLGKYVIKQHTGEMFIAIKITDDRFYIEIRNSDGSQVDITEIDFLEDNNTIAAKSLLSKSNNNSIQIRPGYLLAVSGYKATTLNYSNNEIYLSPELLGEYLYMSAESCNAPLDDNRTVFSLISKGDISRYYAMEQVSPGRFKTKYPVIISEFSPDMQALEYTNKLTQLDYYNECRPAKIAVDYTFSEIVAHTLKSALKLDKIAQQRLLQLSVALTAHDVTKCSSYEVFKNYEAGEERTIEFVKGLFDSEELDVIFVVEYANIAHKLNTKWTPGQEAETSVFDVSSPPIISSVQFPHGGVSPDIDYTVTSGFLCAANEKYSMSISGSDGYEDLITGVYGGGDNEIVTLIVPGAEAGVVDTINVVIYQDESKSDSQTSTVIFRN